MKKIVYSLAVIACCAGFTSCKTTGAHEVQATAAAFIICLLWVLFVALGLYSNILRDAITDVDEFKLRVQQLAKGQRRKLVDKTAPFSLTKVQFGLWTVIIASVYVYLALCKGDCSETAINKTALVLMGISAGTIIASSVMDKNEINNNQPRHQDSPSQGFFLDILSDENGVSLHRFQNMAWTVIAITVYLYKVSQVTEGCQLPELSDTLLALTGISSATYLALKSKENDGPLKDFQITSDRTASTTVTINGTSQSTTVQLDKTA